MMMVEKVIVSWLIFMFAVVPIIVFTVSWTVSFLQRRRFERQRERETIVAEAYATAMHYTLGDHPPNPDQDLYEAEREADIVMPPLPPRED